MEDLKLKNDDSNKVLWQTEFFAVNVTTGLVDKFRGIFITAASLADAYVALRKMNMPFLQLSGQWFRDFEVVLMNDKFKKPINDATLDIEKMSFDEFCDWLDNAINPDALAEAREIVLKTVKTPEEHLKIINTYIKRMYEENNKKEDSSEEDSEEEAR